jgi:hypothetical protein
VKHRAAPRRRRFRPSLTAVLVPTLLITGAAWSGALVTHLGQNDGKVADQGPKEPAATASLDKSTYVQGELMTLRVSDNLWAKHTWSISDTTDRNWTKKSDDKKGATFTATAGSRGGTVTVTLKRTWDDATTKVSVSYNVLSTSPTTSTTTAPTTSAPTTSTPTTSTPTTSTPTTSTPTTSSAPSTTSVPGAQWPGQIPGKFYLGMSCGTICSDKESQLGQGYGVHRQFTSWANWSSVAKYIQADNAAGELPWISVKPPGGDAAGWQAIANGTYDADIKALATMLKANDDKPILFTFHHEPCNDGTEDQGVLWAAAYVRIHDILKSEGALVNVADPPIMSDWLFNPVNQAQDPADWLTNAVLDRAPFIGVDVYENASGETFAQRLPRVLDWLASRGYPNLMVGVGETGSTDTAYPDTTAVDWLNASLTWAAQHTDEIGVVSYFNSTANSKSFVYWPLDESAAKMSAYRSWLDNPVTID